MLEVVLGEFGKLVLAMGLAEGGEGGGGHFDCMKVELERELRVGETEIEEIEVEKYLNPRGGGKRTKVSNGSGASDLGSKYDVG